MKDLFGHDIVDNTRPKKRTRSEIFNDYDGFLDKFKKKKTTDDCYTPEKVYDAVLSFVRESADIDGLEIVRPFYPGGDYENFNYPDRCVVVDNPPFSIISRIARFYMSRGIRFFLFAPHLTLFSTKNIEWTCIVCGAGITYENGAVVNTSFISNLFGDVRIMTAPRLRKLITLANKATKEKINKLRYPVHVVSSALLGKIAPFVDFMVSSSECIQIRKLDNQKDSAIFGGGFLISERAAAERAAAEQVTEFKLSEREKEIISRLK